MGVGRQRVPEMDKEAWLGLALLWPRFLLLPLKTIEPKEVLFLKELLVVVFKKKLNFGRNYFVYNSLLPASLRIHIWEPGSHPQH